MGENKVHQLLFLLLSTRGSPTGQQTIDNKYLFSEIVKFNKHVTYLMSRYKPEQSELRL